MKKKMIIIINKMACMHCAKTITKALEEQDNILKGRMVQITPQYEVLFKLKNNFKDYKVSDENTYLTINESQIILYNFDLQKFTNK